MVPLLPEGRVGNPRVTPPTKCLIRRTATRLATLTTPAPLRSDMSGAAGPSAPRKGI